MSGRGRLKIQVRISSTRIISAFTLGEGKSCFLTGSLYKIAGFLELEEFGLYVPR